MKKKAVNDQTMRKQLNNLLPQVVSYLTLFLFMLSGNYHLQAQTTVNYSDARSPKYLDYTVPSSQSGKYLYLYATGADGGEATSKSKNGGKGATVEGYVKIGNATNEIPEGATIRFIPGEAGSSYDHHGGGGGGTAIAFKTPSNSDWTLLIVAGAGGGAGSKQAGREGTTTTGGSNGVISTGAQKDNAGSKGSGGTNDGENGYSGGGAFSDADGVDCCDEGFQGQAGMVNNVPTGSAGGAGSENVPGGFGFGSGGSGDKTFAVILGYLYGGGGGGGYSGGGAGGDWGGGGGGGSYANTAFLVNVLKESHSTTSSPADGSISYQYLEEAQLSITRQFKYSNNTSKCLGLVTSSTAAGTDVQLVDCSNTTATQWIIDGERIQLKADQSKCLDLKSNNTNNGSNIQLWSCNGSDAQAWIFEGYNQSFRHKANVNKCINVDQSSGYKIQINTCNEVYYQRWEVDGAIALSRYVLDSGYKNLKMAASSNKCLEVWGGYNSAGTNIQINTCQGDTAQKWIYDGFYIKRYSHQDKCLDLQSSKTSNGNNIQLWNCNNTGAQQWLYDGITKEIRSSINRDKCLDIAGGSTADGTNIQIYDCHGGTKAQQFLIE